jgi:Protein of unknown function (DUF1566)
MKRYKKYVVFVLSFLLSIALLSGCKKETQTDPTPLVTEEFKIGQSYKGGIIFYIDSTGKHGLIAAPSDQSIGISWSVSGDTTRTGAYGQEIGTGFSNTKKIVAMFGSGNYAARICDNLVLGGFDDWFLPSRYELVELWKQKDKVGGFKSSSNADETFYWSSTDLDGFPFALYAANVRFQDGSIKFNGAMGKGAANLVRAIRTF